MAEAEVGDDQFGDDRRSTASRSASPDCWAGSRALVPDRHDGQPGRPALTSPGDDVIVSRGSHAVWHETGGSGANAGVQLTEIGRAARSPRAEFEAAVKPEGHLITRRRRSSRSRTPTTAPGALSSPGRRGGRRERRP